MKQKFFVAGIVLLSSILPPPHAWAAESLIFENDGTRPFNARTLIIDNPDKGGDLTLQFGKTLNEQLLWDSSASKFTFTDDLDVQGTMSGAAVHAAGGNVTIDTEGTSIFNVNGNAVNFRIATDNETNMFFVDGTNDRVGIKTSSPEVELEIIGTASGRHLHAQDLLTSSGALAVEGAANIHGTLSGNTITGFNLSDCDNASTSKLLWDETTQTFSCGTDTDTDTSQQTTFTLTGDSGSNQTISHGNTLDIEGGASITTTVGATDKVTVDITDDAVDFTEISDTPSLDADTTLSFGSNTLTFNLESTGDFNIQDNGTSVFFVQDDGNIGIGTTSPTETLEIVGTASGRTIHAQDLLTASGTLAVEGAAHLQGAATFGSTITVGGITYTFPTADGSASGKVLATDSAGQLSWTTGGGTNLTLSADTGSDQSITENNTIEIAGGAEITTTASATDTVTIDITDDTVDFAELQDTLDLDASTTLNFGANNFIYDLTSTGDFAVRDNGSAAFFVNDSGNVGVKTETPTEALEVVGTASGTKIHAQDLLTSSGGLIVEGAARLNSTLNIGGVTYTFPSADGSSGTVLKTDASGGLSWGLLGSGALKTREKKIYIPIDTAAITTDGTDNEVNVFVGSQTGSTANPHHYYRVATGSGQLQDTDIRIKVLVPRDFVDFSNSNDLSFTYRTHSASDSDNKLDILVEDDDGDDAFTAADGQGLANTSWTTYTDEFDGGSFDPLREEYIHISIKGYTTSSGMTYAGEVVLTYTAR